MQKVLVNIGKFVLVGFLCWHMAVVGVTCLPDRSEFSLVKTVRAEVLPYTELYTYSLSQWQNWGLFSQASVSSVMIHTMEEWDKDTDTWHEIASLDLHTLPWWSAEYETALLRTIDADYAGAARVRYLQLKCQEMKLPKGTWVRLAYPSFDMPITDPPIKPTDWMKWEPSWKPWGDSVFTQCPAADEPLPPWEPSSSSSSSAQGA